MTMFNVENRREECASSAISNNENEEMMNVVEDGGAWNIESAVQSSRQ